MIKHHIPLIGAVILLTAALSASLWAYAQPAATPTVFFRGRVYAFNGSMDSNYLRPLLGSSILYQSSSLSPATAELTTNSAALQGLSFSLTITDDDYYKNFPDPPRHLLFSDPFTQKDYYFWWEEDRLSRCNVEGRNYNALLYLGLAAEEIMNLYNFYPIETRLFNCSTNSNDRIGTLAERYNDTFPVNGTLYRILVDCPLYFSDQAKGTIIQFQDGSYGYLSERIFGGLDSLHAFLNENNRLSFQGKIYHVNAFYIYTDNEFAQLQRDGIFLTTPAEERTVASSWKVYDGLTVYQSERFPGVIAIEADWPDGSKRYIYCKTSS